MPFWLPQMDIDIRKQSRFGKVEIHRPYQGTPGGSNTSSGSHSASNSPRTIEAQPYNEPVSDGDDDEEVYTKIVGGMDEAKQVKLPDNVIARVNEARAFREEKLRREAEAREAAGSDDPSSRPAVRSSASHNDGPSLSSSNGFHIDPLSGSRQYDAKYSSMLDKVGLSKLFKTKQQREEADARGEPVDPDDQPPEMVRFHAPQGKRISVPVRIEPKVIFANEVRATPRLPPVVSVSISADLNRSSSPPRWFPHAAHVPQVAQLRRHARGDLDRPAQLCLGRRRRRHVLGLCLLDLRARRRRLRRRHVPVPRARAAQGAPSRSPSLPTRDAPVADPLFSLPPLCSATRSSTTTPSGRPSSA